jgi:hypothetical protein
VRSVHAAQDISIQAFEAILVRDHTSPCCAMPNALRHRQLRNFDIFTLSIVPEPPTTEKRTRNIH